MVWASGHTVRDFNSPAGPKGTGGGCGQPVPHHFPSRLLLQLTAGGGRGRGVVPALQRGETETLRGLSQSLRGPFPTPRGKAPCADPSGRTRENSRPTLRSLAAHCLGQGCGYRRGRKASRALGGQLSSGTLCLPFPGSEAGSGAQALQTKEGAPAAGSEAQRQPERPSPTHFSLPDHRPENLGMNPCGREDTLSSQVSTGYHFGSSLVSPSGPGPCPLPRLLSPHSLQTESSIQDTKPLQATGKGSARGQAQIVRVKVAGRWGPLPRAEAVHIGEAQRGHFPWKHMRVGEAAPGTSLPIQACPGGPAELPFPSAKKGH